MQNSREKEGKICFLRLSIESFVNRYDLSIQYNSQSDTSLHPYASEKPLQYNLQSCFNQTLATTMIKSCRWFFCLN